MRGRKVKEQMKQVSLESQAQELDFDTVGTRASARQQVADAMREKKTILGFVISTHGFSLINARCQCFSLSIQEYQLLQTVL